MPSLPLTAAVLLLLLTLLAVGTGMRLQLWRKEEQDRQLARRKQRLSKRGEWFAPRLMRKHGYRVVERQPTAPVRIKINGKEKQYNVRADFIVRKGRKRFVAEVKTGDLVASTDHAPTRRQILEYRLAFNVKGAILVDIKKDNVVELEFTTPGVRPRDWTGWWVAGLATLALIAECETTPSGSRHAGRPTREAHHSARAGDDAGIADQQQSPDRDELRQHPADTSSAAERDLTGPTPFAPRH